MKTHPPLSPGADQRGVRALAHGEITGRAIVELWARRRYSKAAERSPAPGRTPGSGSSPKRRVMSLMIDVVS